MQPPAGCLKPPPTPPKGQGRRAARALTRRSCGALLVCCLVRGSVEYKAPLKLTISAPTMRLPQWRSQHQQMRQAAEPSSPKAHEAHSAASPAKRQSRPSAMYFNAGAKAAGGTGGSKLRGSTSGNSAGLRMSQAAAPQVTEATVF